MPAGMVPMTQQPMMGNFEGSDNSQPTGVLGSEVPLRPKFLYPKALRTHVLRLLGLKTIPYKVFGPFRALVF